MKLFKQIISLERHIVDSLENSSAPFIYFILTFLFATTLRNFLEIFSVDPSILLWRYLHYYLSYVALAMTLMLLFYLVTKTDILKIAKVVLPSFFILILAPILDLIISKGKGFHITYLLPGSHDNLILRYFTFFGDFPGAGVTPGMRIEIAIALIASFIYFYLKNSKLIKSFFFTILTYTLIFYYCAAPFVIKAILEFFGLKLEYGYPDMLFVNFYLIVIFLAGIVLAYLANKKYFKLIIDDIRPFRVAHYELMFVLGLILGQGAFRLDFTNFHYFIFIPISIIFAWLFSVVTNNIQDYKIDEISNRDRPLIDTKINLQDYKKIAWVFLFIALFYAAMVNFQTFFLILLFIGNYFLYSMPPLRLKRVPFFSKLAISLNSLILVMLGYLIITGTIEGFPNLIIAIFLIGLTAAANFIDIKDYQGDKQAAIKTLPVILGLKKAKFIIGLFFVLTSLSVYFLIRDVYLIIPLAIFGSVLFYLINKKDYQEKPIFLVYLFGLIMLIIYLVIYMRI